MPQLPQYPNLGFSSNVDYQHVDPVLWQKLNDLVGTKGLHATVISGYRNEQNPAGFKGDPHQKGLAADVYINGKPIASFFSVKEFQNAGLRTGAQSQDFYKGAPDPEHVDLMVYDGSKPRADIGNWNWQDPTGAQAPPQAPTPPPVPPTQQAVPTQAQPVQPATVQGGGPEPSFSTLPDPLKALPPLLTPAEGDAFSPAQIEQIWKHVSTLPFSTSQSTSQYASAAAGG